MKRILRILITGLVGLILAYFINTAAPFGASIGINLVNALFIGILGLPGLITLYIIAAIS
jgi:hypothetical protein